jgi:RNA polymerase sigma-70 factor (ECF subfamily)
MGGVRDSEADPSPADAVERLYREQGDRIWRALLGFAGDPDVASDAEAEAFAQLLRRGAEVRDPERWVWRAAFRIAAGELKTRRRHVPRLEEGAYELSMPSIELGNALRQLSDRQRSAVVLHYIADRPVREVAAILGMTSGSVKVHLSRGRAHLRALLGDAE